MIAGAYGLPNRFISGTFDGLVFGREDGDVLFKASRWDGWFGSPGIRADRADRLWGHGTFSDRGWRDDRLIVIEGNARFGNEQAARDGYNRLMAAGAEGTYNTLSVSDSLFGDQTAEVRLANEVVADWLTPGILKYQIQLLAPDPRKYGPLFEASTGVAAPGGGLVYPLGSPNPPGILDYGARGTPGTVALANAGTADTAPVFTVRGELPGGFTITHVETGRRLVYAGAVIPGQYLRIDAGSGAVKIDGYADRSSLLTVRQWSRLGKYATGTWLFEAPGSTAALLTVGVKSAWW